MGVIQGGINLGAPILPATTDDVFPTHDANYGKGGYHTAATAAERNTIKPARRSIGMAVRTLDDNVVWILTNDNGSATLENAAWTREEDTLSMDGGEF
jgi:hypothetical protein